MASSSIAHCLIGLSLFVISLSKCSGQPRSAICFLQPDPAASLSVTGIVEFFQAKPTSDLRIKVRAQGFDPAEGTAEHGFHVHELGDITGGCGSTQGHYNPAGVDHGAPTDSKVARHAGDFGNVRQCLNGTLHADFSDSVASLFGERSIVGRAIVVHAGMDDLGRGGDEGSRTTGNAGARLACCVIGLAR